MRRFYFKPGQREPSGRLPKQAYLDCSVPGQPADEAVAYWTRVLRFDADPRLTADYLRGFGAWDDDELADHAANLKRLFWLLCGNKREDPSAPLYLGD